MYKLNIFLKYIDGYKEQNINQISQEKGVNSKDVIS